MVYKHFYIWKYILKYISVYRNIIHSLHAMDWVVAVLPPGGLVLFSIKMTRNGALAFSGPTTHPLCFPNGISHKEESVKRNVPSYFLVFLNISFSNSLSLLKSGTTFLPAPVML